MIKEILRAKIGTYQNLKQRKVNVIIARNRVTIGENVMKERKINKRLMTNPRKNLVSFVEECYESAEVLNVYDSSMCKFRSLIVSVRFI